MMTLLLSRHGAAQNWLLAEARLRGWQPLCIATHAPLLLPRHVGRVAGVLPLAMAAAWAAAGIETWHLSLPLTLEFRGRELTDKDMEQLGARLVRVHVRVEGDA